MNQVGIVAIGRNEGARLTRCLKSLPAGIRGGVYVDSGSTDDSLERARGNGIEVVALDMSVPFTAARARNAGFDRLLQLYPDVQLVHFVDGDCEFVPGAIEAALAEMNTAPDIVVVCGWTRERHPERTPFNALCDVEWRMRPVGDTQAFGGIFLVRAAAYRAVGGFNPDVIAAEDDEIGIRLRQAGGRFRRIDHVSVLHDAGITRIGQWWTRAKRCGHGYAQVADMHGGPPERYFVPEVKRTCAWGMGLPLAAAVLAPPTLGLSLWLLAAYPLQMARTFRATRRKGFDTRYAALWGVSCTAAKIPESLGVIKYHLNKLRRRRPTIIEYKGQE
ncbi:MAG: glycosyltransferase family 2 protein [Deltaproteobacteria bacterium]|nr:glycosyltransferase family 2 protein [Deltaproteobacteria bacterium]